MKIGAVNNTSFKGTLCINTDKNDVQSNEFFDRSKGEFRIDTNKIDDIYANNDMTTILHHINTTKYKTNIVGVTPAEVLAAYTAARQDVGVKIHI